MAVLTGYRYNNIELIPGSRLINLGVGDFGAIHQNAVFAFLRVCVGGKGNSVDIPYDVLLHLLSHSDGKDALCHKDRAAMEIALSNTDEHNTLIMKVVKGSIAPPATRFFPNTGRRMADIDFVLCFNLCADQPIDIRCELWGSHMDQPWQHKAGYGSDY